MITITMYCLLNSKKNNIKMILNKNYIVKDKFEIFAINEKESTKKMYKSLICVFQTMITKQD